MIVVPLTGPRVITIFRKMPPVEYSSLSPQLQDMIPFVDLVHLASILVHLGNASCLGETEQNLSVPLSY
jgi:hypothetical protein